MQSVGGWRDRFERHWIVVLAGVTGIAIFLAFLPVFSMGLVTDDFVQIGMHHYDALDALAHDDIGLWLSRLPERILTDPVNGAEVVRPVRIAFFISDYFQWHLNPFGYHLSDVLFYFGASFVVGLLAWQLTRRKGAAFVTTLLFALMPVHAAPVAEIASRGHVLAGLFVALTVLMYALPRTRGNVFLSWFAFVLALGSKETALVTPALLVLYEVVYTGTALWKERRAVVLRLLPFFLITVAYFGLRVLLFGRFTSLAEGSGSIDWNFLLAGYTQYAVQPLFDDITDPQMRLALAVGVVLLLLYRKRREVVFGFLWYPIALLPVLVYPPQERYFFTPSIGLAIALGCILAQPFPRGFRYSRSVTTAVSAAAGALTVVILVALGIGLFNRNMDHRTASQVIERILAQLQKQEPTLPPRAKLIMVGLPERLRYAYIFTHPRQVEYAVKLAYGDRSVVVETPTDFPTRLDTPARTFFFEYADKTLTERTDLVQAIREHRTCADAPDKIIRWDFDTGAEGWEAWNEIENLGVRDGGLHFNTTGDDPFMGGPLMQVSPQELDHVEIRMRARADKPTFNAELFWQTESMEDFSGEARSGFAVNADGETHVYTPEVRLSGDAPLVRLRLDPADMPAEIEVEAVTVFCR